MRWANQLRMRLRSVFGRRRVEDELDAELRFHLDRQVEDNLTNGMSLDEARSSASRSVGSVLLIKDGCRESLGLRLFDELRQDVRYALRTLRRSPGFTAVAVLTLAIGIGVNATVFTVTNGVLFKGFPSVIGNDRLLYIDSRQSEGGCCLSYPDFEDWRAQATSFEGVAVVNGLDLTLSDKGFPETMFAAQVSANAFTVIGQRPIIGRDFASSDETPGAAPVAILSYGLWERRYEKDPAIIGETIKIGGIAAGSVTVHGDSSAIAPTTVIGVIR